MNDHPAPGRRGSLPGLALATGLLAFLIADGRSADGSSSSPPSPGGDLPGSPGAVAAFFVAAGAVIVLFVLLVAGSALHDRVIRLAGVISARDSVVPKQPTRRWRRRNHFFVRAVDEFLEATDRLGPDEQQFIEYQLSALVTADEETRFRILSSLLTAHDGQLIYFAVRQLEREMRPPGKGQLAYLAAAVQARQALR
ncbi:hypothetical protein GCM10029976_029820 [Kribbella albertanoniae]|uniref:Uncharacterized protein n=1 Tax=Kribbella albertanoniae TaxID=1266829 RepID=A0A4V2XPD8_9ACTN|nr:hypothetical protein [Kribbella albertanoniae]TDC21685.1 hypothetical protein E1261_32790 [Kribbella albertanoniae]